MLDTSDPLRNIGPRNYIEVQQNTITTFIISDVVVKISEVQNEDNKRKKSATLQQVCVSLDHCLGVLDSCSGGL